MWLFVTEEGMMRSTLMSLLSFGMLVAVSGAVLASEEERVPLDKVPTAAKAAADKAVPGVRWKKAEKEQEDGKTIYELKGRDPKGKKIEVEVSPDGKQVSVEEKVSLDAVPTAVKQAADKAVPGAKWKWAEQEKEGDKTFYELKGRDPRGKQVKLEISADGKQVKAEDCSRSE
jgi:uncharacterized membrane protein YkoI